MIRPCFDTVFCVTVGSPDEVLVAMTTYQYDTKFVFASHTSFVCTVRAVTL